MAKKTYSGGCQCGAVRYDAELDLDHTLACNCSRCGRLGSIQAFTPAESFTLQSGEEALREYRFNKHVIAHLFCGTCGIQSFSRGELPDGTRMVAVNARCLDGVDPATLSPGLYDGASL